MSKWIICGLVIVAVAAFAIRTFGIRKLEAQTDIPQSAVVAIGAGHLSKQEFWALVDHSAAFEAHPELQLKNLEASLERLTPDQIAEFEQMFDETMRQSYTWDLWGAAYLANGGASDDGFEYFRCWLISKGRAVYETVVANPDSLADLLAPGSQGDLEFEDFAYVARHAWAAKTRRDWNDMPVIANMAYDTEPKGTPLSENPSALAKRYPKLWNRFGGN